MLGQLPGLGATLPPTGDATDRKYKEDNGKGCGEEMLHKIVVHRKVPDLPLAGPYHGHETEVLCFQR